MWLYRLLQMRIIKIAAIWHERPIQKYKINSRSKSLFLHTFNNNDINILYYTWN